MSRVRFKLPDRFLFTTEIPLRVSDINYGGHLGNDAVLSLAQEARMRFPLLPWLDGTGCDRCRDYYDGCRRRVSLGGILR